ncbi:pre-mRNA-splicing factor SLU7 [Tothia fuscella]|uniref:Pre-mRNA-splicing factor SLU7 n=1 Tax=Tothia fuscella TaxID=1048955 RepID=A0A9P4P068_9PEZI|nr:pre-mRNA-splicing factor SLU7 [Tothia fuscella]
MPEAFRQPKKPDISASAKDKNEYIPSFIANKPFYVPDTGDDDGSGKDYLEHQRLQKKEDDSLATSQWYDRGKKRGPAATKYRKGACENCGAITHKTKDCLSRKRKIGAKYTGRDIQADEVVADVNLGWDAKRDRWNGYDAREYDAVVEEYNQLEALKKSGKGADGEGDEGDRYEEETDMGRQQATSTRNLRLREDTAKYLLNLDLDSAKYDPKTRSLVDSGAQLDQAALLVAEEGFVKKSGDAAEFERAQRYAWEAQERSGPNKIHLQANPTAGESLRKKELEDSKVRREAQRKALLDKYGDQPDNSKLKDLALTESERYVEYDERGGVKGAIKSKPKSKYPEDVYINNHTSVWGSWWSDFKWGYVCCHSMVRNSYCTGEEGRQAFDEANRLRTAADLDIMDEDRVPKNISWKEEEEQEKHIPNGVEDDRIANADKRKRTLDEMKSGVTEEDMEEYKRKRTQANDPMAKLLGKDELL